MAEPEKRGGGQASAAEEEEESLLGKKEGAVLDFDALCSTVAMQAQKGKWGKRNGDGENEEEEIGSYLQNGGGVYRMWEGEVFYDCFDDRRLALESFCCPCYRFGNNMKRAGFGSCFLQGSIYLILLVIALSNLLAFAITRNCYFLYLAITFALAVGTYMGYYRIQIKKKFNIKGGDSSFDDFVYHLICPSCTLCQESRTLEMNNVQDGMWHGRGDTICIGSFFEDTKAYLESSPQLLTMSKNSNDRVLLPASPPLIRVQIWSAYTT